MAQTPPQLERAIDDILAQARAELVRMHADGDIGTVVIHCGKEQWRVKAHPERIYESVSLQSNKVRPTDTLR
jgi:hypothetical protein